MMRQSLPDLAKQLLKRPSALIGTVLLIVLVSASIFAPLLAPFDPYDAMSIDIMDSELPPRWQDEGDERFVIGTDGQGRDLYSSILYGMRVSLLIGIGAVILQSTIGILLGLLAGYAGKHYDRIIMRMADIQLSFSTLMVAIIALGITQTAFGPEAWEKYAIPLLILVIGLSEWPQYARTVRASVLAEKEKDYIDAAKVLGSRSRVIVFKHILPNIASPLIVISAVQIANAIMAEAALSFLGLGMPITRPSLGSLINSGFEYVLSGEWWMTAFPGGALIVLVLAVNLISDWLRDALNPKLR
jgi:peptide/nickel transport system permease protein